MAIDLIVPDQLPRWVPGRLTVHSPEVGWDGLSVRGYRYAGSDVDVPPMRDYLIVAYRRGQTSMRRRIDRAWIQEMLGPATSRCSPGPPPRTGCGRRTSR